uniref:THO complex subunit 5 n=1 Tax=Acrobeloides nanus TaxID=290746 RepID=A0A914C0S5_9BILA
MAPQTTTKSKTNVTSTKTVTREPLPTATLQGFYNQEDEAAQNLTDEKIHSDLASFTNSIRSTITNNLSNTDIWTNDEFRHLLLLQTAKLRRLNKLSNFRNKLYQDRLGDARKKVEQHYLFLQNLKSEIAHLQKAIETCLEFRSADTDLELIPVEEFYDKAPETISKPEITKDNSHEQRLARLNYELHERKSILGIIQEMDSRKDVLLTDIKGKEQRLSQVKPKIVALKETARPLLDILGLKSVSESTMEMYKKVGYLPEELKVLYVNTGVYNELFPEDPIHMSCDGDIQAAINLKNSTAEVIEEDEEEQEKEEEEEMKEEEEEESKKNRKKKSKRKEKEVNEKLQKKKDKLLTAYPISLSMEINFGKKTKAKLTFIYLSEIKCVSLKCKLDADTHYPSITSAETIFDELYDHDFAEKCPSTVSQALLDMLDIDLRKHVSNIGKPYKFLQKLCCVPSNDQKLQDGKPLAQQTFEFFIQVLQRIKDRLKSRVALSKKLQELESGKFLNNLPTNIAEKFPQKILSRMSGFKLISAEDFLLAPSYTNEQKAIVNNLNSAHDLDRGILCMAYVERADFRLYTYVYVPTAYPRPGHFPTMLLVVRTDPEKLNPSIMAGILSLENYINTQAIDYIDAVEQEDELLPVMFGLLMSRLDVVLEVASKRQGTNDFPLEHLYTAYSRGKTQDFPFYYDSINNSYGF